MGRTKIRQEQLVTDSIAVPYARSSWVNGTGHYSTTSTTATYIDQTNAKATLTLKYGKLVMVDLNIGGVWNTNTGYSVMFDVGLGGTSTTSTSGYSEFNSACTFGNWSIDGSLCVVFTGKYFFTNVGAGSKDFYALWNTNNATVTAHIRQYARCYMTVTELYMA